MIQIIALLFASDKGIEGLREFESRAIKILREHQGELISASFNDIKGVSEPDEIHVIQFPSLEHFENYKQDTRLIALASLKNEMIKSMQVFLTNRFHHY